MYCKFTQDTTSRLLCLLQVVAATRIHNRHLRTQFGRHWQPGGAVEYLFFDDPAGVLVGEPVLCIRPRSLQARQPLTFTSAYSSSLGPTTGQRYREDSRWCILLCATPSP
jgi:hypothetical protein